MDSSAQLLKAQGALLSVRLGIRHRRRERSKRPAANPSRIPDSQIIEGSDGPSSDFQVDLATENNECFMTFVATTTCAQGMFILDSLSWLVF